MTAAAPSGLAGHVVAAFSRHGPLARADAGYVRREVQERMAVAVAEAIEAREPLVAEAGTGVGKTYAYLVPVLLSGARALVSTATKNLQDQLYLRDLPRLRDALGLPLTIALLKGRASYLCLHRLQQARQAIAPSDRWMLRTIAQVERWSQSTVNGDVAELDGIDERHGALPLFTSTRDNCLGSDCPQFRPCHVMKARRDAMAADLVVVNHHLFFADMALRDSGVAELLPSVGVAVFDEAHQLGEAGVQFLGAILGSGPLLDFSRDMVAAGLQHARGLAPWQDLAAHCDTAGRALRLAAAGPALRVAAPMKLRWDERADRDDFRAALAGVEAACRAARDALEPMTELAPDFDRLLARGDGLLGLAMAFAAPVAPSQVRWIDLTATQVRLVESPLDIRAALQAQMRLPDKAWIFTSATLGDDERLSWFTEPAGLTEARTLRLGSPFDYASNARLYVPTAFPKPADPGHAEAVAALAMRCVDALGGRTFVLTTTLRALRAIGDLLRSAYDRPGAGITVLVQGQAPKRQLLHRFETEGPAVLVGSQSFWEGIDVPGEALQCVVIDKLPFPPPNDPLVQARSRRLEADGRNAFADHFVAEAAVSLKQGAGRLIRHEHDRGLIVVCDARLATAPYGLRLRRALPEMPLLTEEADALTWLRSLAGAAPSGVDEDQAADRPWTTGLDEQPDITTGATTASWHPAGPAHR